MDPNLTLEKAVAETHQKETVKKQQSTVRSDLREETSVEPVRARFRRRSENTSYPSRRHSENRALSSSSARQKNCTRCGRSPPHGRSQCPANDAVRHKCQKKGHFQQMCKTKKSVNALLAEDSEEEPFLGMIHADAVSAQKPWEIDIQTNGRPISYKIDTGADVTVIPETDYREEDDGPLQSTSRVLSGPTRDSLEVLGKFSGQLRTQSKQTQQEIFMVHGLRHGLRQPLLGRPVIQALGIVSRIESVEETNYVQRFPKLFKGLGRMKQCHTIQLKEGAKPYALSAPRRVAIPLLPKVKEELQRMEKMGVISKVEEPTEWCAGMVVPKSNGKVRICVDLAKLNESVCRERHILPSVEQTLAQIGEAKVFSKLDAVFGKSISPQNQPP